MNRTLIQAFRTTPSRPHKSNRAVHLRRRRRVTRRDWCVLGRNPRRPRCVHCETDRRELIRLELVLKQSPRENPASCNRRLLNLHMPAIRTRHDRPRSETVCLLIGLLVLIAGGVLAWRAFKRLEPVTAIILVEAEDSGICSPPYPAFRRKFEAFKHTQAELVRSRRVMQAVAARSDLPRMLDLAAWLDGHLEVYFPGDAEVMLVSLPAGSRPEDTVRLLDAVVEEYMKVNEEECDEEQVPARVRLIRSASTVEPGRP